jgi:D-aminoacyl-tRNA deacylase
MQAPVYRRLAAMTARSPLKSDFEVSLEGTHHGPWVTTPAMFAEIGSQQEQWQRRDAADLWADVLVHELLGHELLGGSSGPSDDVTSGNWWDARWKSGGDGRRAEDGEGSKSIALVCIGGGHYAPKHGDLVRGAGAHVFLGHILPSYTMHFTGDAREWQDCVRDAVEATRKGFAPGTPEIVCHIDKKAFKAPQRDELVGFIELQLGLRVAFQANQLAQPANQTT